LRRVLLVFILYSFWVPGVEGAVDEDVLTLVQKISSDRIDVDVQRLVAFETRFMGSDSNAAASVWLGERLTALGYTVRFDTFDVQVSRRTYFTGHTFEISGLKQWNVIARKRGSLYPNKKIVIGGHYDTIALDRAQSAQDVAPGADDNASGIASVLEMARLMRDVDVDMTVEFAFWGAEELGLIGSDHYAKQARENDEDIVVMLQLDAIGTRSTLFTNGFSIDTISPYITEGNVLVQTALDYSLVEAQNGTGGQLRITSRGCGCSDHQSFINVGYPALGIFQFYDNPAPHLNMSTDTIDHVDLALVTGITQATLGALLEFSGFPGRSADFDGNGQVAFADFLLFAQVFGSEMGFDVRFDLDRDGVVGFNDFLIFATAFGQ